MIFYSSLFSICSSFLEGGRESECFLKRRQNSMMCSFAVIPTMPHTAVMINTVIESCQRPSIMLEPIMVEENIEGRRANVESRRKRLSVISVIPTKYVSISFGVPGTKNKIKTIVPRRFESWIQFHFLTRSFPKTKFINFLPKRSESLNTIEDAATQPAIHIKSPPNGP